MQTAARRIALSNPSSSPLAKRVYIESSDVVNRSTGHWCRRSFAASISSNPSKQQKVHQKVSKAERRAKVVAFVDRYRALNGGKIPNITHAQQEVGGSFYFIRQIIQELEYNHKVASIKGTRLGEVEKAIYPNLDVKEESLLSKAGNSILENAPLVGQTVPDTQIDVEILENDPLRLSTQGREGTDHDYSKSQAAPSVSVDVQSKLDILHVPPLDTQGGRQDVGSIVLEQEPIGSKERDEQRNTEECSMPEKVASEKAEPLEEGSPSQKGSSIWGNLKSLADGIISFWKKM